LFNIQQILDELWILAAEVEESTLFPKEQTGILFQLINKLEERIKYIEKIIF